MRRPTAAGIRNPLTLCGPGLGRRELSWVSNPNGAMKRPPLQQALGGRGLGRDLLPPAPRKAVRRLEIPWEGVCLPAAAGGVK